MKKAFSLLAAAAVLSSGMVFAQAEQSHEVNVKIPNVLRIRLTQGDSNAAATNPDPVEFDFITREAVFDTGTIFGPTNGPTYNWDDVRVFSNNQNGWEVFVTVDNSDFDWGKIKVAADGVHAFNGGFDLDGGSIAGHSSKTGGWESLGFGPQDFTAEFDGSEDAGTYSTTVTYTILEGL